MAYNKIVLYGKQTCDYLYIQTDAPSDDEFSYDVGWHIAKNRLLDKYLWVRARIAKRIRKAVYKDVYKLGKIGKRDRKKGW